MNTLRRFVYQLKRRLRGRICPDCHGSGTLIGAIYENALLLLSCPRCKGRGHK